MEKPLYMWAVEGQPTKHIFRQIFLSWKKETQGPSLSWPRLVMLAYKNMWRPTNGLVANHRTKMFNLFSVSVLNTHWTFSATLTWGGTLRPSTNTDWKSICPSVMHLFVHHVLPREAMLSKQYHTHRFIHHVNGVIGRSLPCEWPWHTAGSQTAFSWSSLNSISKTISKNKKG